MAGIGDAEAYWFLKNYTSGNLLDESVNNHDSDAITNVLIEGGTTNIIRHPGINGNYLSVPDSVALSVTGDIDLRWVGSMEDYTPAAIGSFASKYRSTGNQRSFTFQMDTDGTPRVLWTPDGSTLNTINASAATGFTDGTKQGLRVTIDVSTGDVKFYTLDTPASDDPTNAANWTQLGTTQSGNSDAIFDSTAVVEVGSRIDGTNTMLFGETDRMLMYDGIEGTLVLDIDPDSEDGDAVAQAGTFAENSSNAATVTINQTGTAELCRIVDRQVFWHDTDALVTIPDDAALDFDPTSDVWTYGIAFRTYDTSPAADSVLMAKKTNLGTADGYASYLEAGDATAKGVIADGANSDVDISGNLTAGKAHTIIVRFDGDETEIFLDGTGGGPTTTSLAADAANAVKLIFGARSGPGNFSQFEWWSAAVIPLALSDAEIATLATALLDQTDVLSITAPFVEPVNIFAPQVDFTIPMAFVTPSTAHAPQVDLEIPMAFVQPSTAYAPIVSGGLILPFVTPSTAYAPQIDLSLVLPFVEPTNIYAPTLQLVITAPFVTPANIYAPTIAAIVKLAVAWNVESPEVISWDVEAPEVVSFHVTTPEVVEFHVEVGD